MKAKFLVLFLATALLLTAFTSALAATPKKLFDLSNSADWDACVNYTESTVTFDGTAKVTGMDFDWAYLFRFYQGPVEMKSGDTNTLTMRYKCSNLPELQFYVAHFDTSWNMTDVGAVNFNPATGEGTLNPAAELSGMTYDFQKDGDWLVVSFTFTSMSWVDDPYVWIRATDQHSSSKMSMEINALAIFDGAVPIAEAISALPALPASGGGGSSSGGGSPQTGDANIVVAVLVACAALALPVLLKKKSHA